MHTTHIPIVPSPICSISQPSLSLNAKRWQIGVNGCLGLASARDGMMDLQQLELDRSCIAANLRSHNGDR